MKYMTLFVLVLVSFLSVAMYAMDSDLSNKKMGNLQQSIVGPIKKLSGMAAISYIASTKDGYINALLATSGKSQGVICCVKGTPDGQVTLLPDCVYNWLAVRYKQQTESKQAIEPPFKK